MFTKFLVPEKKESTEDVNNKWQMTQAVIRKSESGKCEVFVASQMHTHGKRDL